MKSKRKFIIITSIIVFFSLLTIRPLSLWAEPNTRAVHATWQQANDIGAYQFTTEIVQTTRPLVTILNVSL